MLADAELLWPLGQLGEAIELLARRARLIHPSRPARALDAPPSAAVGPYALARWAQEAAEQLGIEAEPIKETHANLARALCDMGAALWRVPLPGGARFVLIVEGKRRFGAPHAVSVLGRDGREHDLPAAWLAELLRRQTTDTERCGAERVLERAGISPTRRDEVLRALVDDGVANRFVEGGILLRPHPGASLLWQARRLGALRTALTCGLAHALHYAFFLAAWAGFGRATLAGWLDGGWLVLCGLLLLSAIPLRLWAAQASGRLSLTLGCLLKHRLLYRMFRQDPDVVRKHGSGDLFARTVEAERIEALALSGGIAVVLAAIELAFVAAVLAAGAAPVLHLGLLALFLGAALALGVRAFRQRSQWMARRLALTGELVERMTGHRTRLAQQDPAHWHDGEDAALSPYVTASREVDHATARATVGIGRCFLPLAALLLLPALTASQAQGMLAAIAISLGGMLLGQQSLGKLIQGMFALVDAAIAWSAVAPLIRPELKPVQTSHAIALDPTPAHDVPLIELRRITFARPGRLAPVLSECDLAIRDGEQILIEGPSGAGKSTVTALLGCLRLPTSGSLLLRGLDHHILGESAWRRIVACAPQFHDNHVLTGTFAYNALLGRGWPASPSDLDEVEAVCRELGLDELLERMPGGLNQVIGESGWRLSHGEQSRLFLARALLQGADLVLLDETFAALDPENLQRALRCTMRRAPTLVVVAHP